MQTLAAGIGATLLIAAAGAHAQPANPPADIAAVNGTHLHYEIAGSGPAVVLIHGGLVDSRQWDDQMTPLSRGHRVVRYDMRGYGRSAMPIAKFSHVDDLRALLDSLQITRASIVGLSLGGMIAADFALEYPERVDRLVLVGAGLRGDTQPPDPQSLAAYRAGVEDGAEKYFETFLRADLLAGVRDRPAARARMHRMMVENFAALQAIAADWITYPATPTSERLGDIRAPTLVMIGSLDSVNLKNISDMLAAKIPGARKVVVPGASHHPPVETPAEFNRLLLDFVR